MKEIELPPGYVSMWEQASPEAMRAQRQAELADIAEYRARKVQAYKDWADPEKREAMKAEVARASTEERGNMAGKYIDDYRVRTVKGETFIGKRLKVGPEYVKVVPKKTWWQRLVEWFETL